MKSEYEGKKSISKNKNQSTFQTNNVKRMRARTSSANAKRENVEKKKTKNKLHI